MLRRAKKMLGLRSEAEVVRVAVERVTEMAEFWRLMNRTRANLKPRSVESP